MSVRSWKQRAACWLFALCALPGPAAWAIGQSEPQPDEPAAGADENTSEAGPDTGREPGAETAPQGSNGEPAEPEAGAAAPAAELETIALPAEAPAADPRQGQGSTTVLDDVVVTATKRSTAVSEIPASIDAFNGSDLDEKGLTNLEQILKYSPGVTLIKGNNPDENQVNIRGAGSPGGDLNRPFGLFFEDVPLLNPTIKGAQPDIDPFDLATVEVLKGPQGTLFGGAALVGAIRYVPNVPTHDRLYGSVSYGYGTTAGSNGANAQYTAMLNLPLGEALALRVAGSVRERAGIIDDTWSGQEDVDSTLSAHNRAIISWKPLDVLDAQLTWQNRAVTADAGWAAQIDNTESRQENGQRRGKRDGSESDLDIMGLKLNYTGFDAFSLSLISSQTDKSATFWRDVSGAQEEPQRSNTYSYYEQITATDQATHELRIVSAAPSESSWAWLSNWEYAAGLFYMRAQQAVDINVVLAEPYPNQTPIPGVSDVQVLIFADLFADAVEQALFFDVMHPFFDDRVELNLGGRLFEQKTPVLVQASAATGNPPLPAQPVGPPGEGELVEKGFNPKAAVTLHYSDDIALYVSAAKGFRFGGVNADPFLTGEPPTFYESDSLWNYEVGARTFWLDNRLRFDTTAFLVEWTNKQISQLTSSSPPSEYVRNIGGSRMRGIEASLRAALPWGMSWMINGAFVDARITEGYDSIDGYVEPGSREGSTPRWTGASVLGLDRQLGEFDLDSSLSYTYRSELDSDDPPLGAIGTFDFFILLKNGAWPLAPELSAVISNLTDDNSLQDGGTNGRPEGDPDRLVVARTVVPRTMTLNLKLNF
jgi:iron complex outermembrane receptor protein